MTQLSGSTEISVGGKAQGALAARWGSMSQADEATARGGRQALHLALIPGLPIAGVSRKCSKADARRLPRAVSLSFRLRHRARRPRQAPSPAADRNLGRSGELVDDPAAALKAARLPRLQRHAHQAEAQRLGHDGRQRGVGDHGSGGGGPALGRLRRCNHSSVAVVPRTARAASANPCIVLRRAPDGARLPRLPPAITGLFERGHRAPAARPQFGPDRALVVDTRRFRQLANAPRAGVKRGGVI